MVALLPFSLDHALDAIVRACVEELTARELEFANERREMARARRELEGRLAELEERLKERDQALVETRREIAALRAERPRPAPLAREVVPEATKPPAPVRHATEAERTAPPNNPRLTGLNTLVGLTFGTWFVLERGASAGSGMTYWKCRCIKCGAIKELAALGAFGLRSRRPAWCAACRSARKGKKTPEGSADESADDDDNGGES